jgi:2-polyprenyl-3-methyl-5-hydroxy-6-metoxy-1,4-benzoquinol methylase
MVKIKHMVSENSIPRYRKNINWYQRSSELEIMDDFNYDQADLILTLKELKTINQWLGGNNVTLNALDKVIGMNPKKKEWIIADLGCGGGDMMVEMAKWARKNRIKASFVGIDANQEIIRYAQKNTAAFPEISYECANVFDEKWLATAPDIVTATLFTHHLDENSLILLLKHLKKNGGGHLIVNDLHRHRLAYWSILLLTSLFSRSPMVKNDGPLSVLRAFSRNDWLKTLKKSSIEHFTIKWFWAFRWQLIVPL